MFFARCLLPGVEVVLLYTYLPDIGQGIYSRSTVLYILRRRSEKAPYSDQYCSIYTRPSSRSHIHSRSYSQGFACSSILLYD